jgi:hypothetical protein
MRTLHTALLGAKGAPVALHGLGGIGKTRLAIEYAWSREAVYSALLFVSASDGAALNAGLAALTAFEILDLPEKEARRRDQDHRRPALARVQPDMADDPRQRRRPRRRC